GANGGIYGSVQLGLVVQPVQPNAAREIEQRFLFAELAEHHGGGLQRGQLTVRVEDVELAVVLPEGGPSVGGAVVGNGFVEALAFAHGDGFDDGGKAVAVARKILQHLDRAAGEYHDGDQVRRCHLRADEFPGGFERAYLIARWQCGHIEIEGEQPVVLVPRAAWSLSRDSTLGEFFQDRDVSGWRRQGLRDFRQLLIFEELDRLWSAVF